MNPAVERLLPSSLHPTLRHSFLLALTAQEPMQAEVLPTELLAPALLLAVVAREYDAPDLVDDLGRLRSRTEEEVDVEESVLRAVLQGATLNGKPPAYSEAARAGCGPEEVQLQYLRLGTQFTVGNPYSGPKRGQLLSLSPGRAVVLWYGEGYQYNTFTDGRTGKEVSIEKTGNIVRGCARECPVKPLHAVIPPAEADWLRNAYKELTGTFAETKRRK